MAELQQDADQDQTRENKGNIMIFPGLLLGAFFGGLSGMLCILALAMGFGEGLFAIAWPAVIFGAIAGLIIGGLLGSWSDGNNKDDSEPENQE